ncbi:MAG: hypothetical protein AAGJ18_29720 [Bacteroidota bacterium]
MTTYEEKQSLKIMGLIIPIALFTLAVPIALMLKNGEGWLGLAISIGTLLASALLLYNMRQTIRLDEMGIHYKQTIIHRTFRTIPWTTIKNWQIKKLNALGDYGGWGYRTTGKKKGYIIEGNYCLELDIGKQKLIGLSVKNKVNVEDFIGKHLP